MIQIEKNNLATKFKPPMTALKSNIEKTFN